MAETIDQTLVTPGPETWTYPQQPRRDGVREHSQPFPDTDPQPPHWLEPKVKCDEDDHHKHTWQITPQGLRCWHCAWGYYAVLARAKAVEENDHEIHTRV